jgi:hypothetical protein
MNHEQHQRLDETVMPDGRTHAQHIAERERLARERAYFNRHGRDVPALERIGVRLGYPASLGQPWREEERERLREQAHRRQRVRHAVTLGFVVTLPDGRKIQGGEEITRDDLPAGLDHPDDDYRSRAWQELVVAGAITSIGSDELLRRTTPRGVYVVAAPKLRGLRKVFARGERVTEKDFPGEKFPSQPTLKELTQHVIDGTRPYMQYTPSVFSSHLSSGKIVQGEAQPNSDDEGSTAA